MEINYANEKKMFLENKSFIEENRWYVGLKTKQKNYKPC